MMVYLSSVWSHHLDLHFSTSKMYANTLHWQHMMEIFIPIDQKSTSLKLHICDEKCNQYNSVTIDYIHVKP